MWRNSDLPLLPNAESQQALIHPHYYVPHPNVGVVSAVPLVAGDNKKAKNESLCLNLKLYGSDATAVLFHI